MSMNLLTDDSPLEPDDELLVAYVDGELDNDSRTQLEDRLLDDEELRRRLQDLQQGWDYLDDFPAMVPCEKLVESTLELVVSDMATGHGRAVCSRHIDFCRDDLCRAEFRLPIAIARSCHRREYRCLLLRSRFATDA